MTDTEKLNALVDYIRDAERWHLDEAKRGVYGSGFKSMAIQDIQLFMKHELGIEYVQLPSKLDNEVPNLDYAHRNHIETEDRTYNLLRK